MAFSWINIPRVACTLAALVPVLVAAPAHGFIIDTILTPWTTTASGTRTANGQPVTLTWSFVPDGTLISEASQGLVNEPSNLISFLDTNFGAGPGGGDYTLRPWFEHFQDSFARWESVSGATYVYEPNDDGVAHYNESGQLGVRGDLRIGGTSIDGPQGTLAFNYFPPGGDMVLDTDDSTFFSTASYDYRRLRNVVMHEHGHGLGLKHVSSDTDALLMEAVINVSFDGPQLDDIRGIQYYFGDAYEKTNGGLGNGTAALASGLGTLVPEGSLAIGTDADVSTQTISSSATDFVSLANLSDVDFYSFTTDGPLALNAVLTPRGGVFNQAAEGYTPTEFDANSRVDLLLDIYDTDGVSLLASANEVGVGEAESLSTLILPGAGEYFVRISGTEENTIQDVRAAALGRGPPRSRFRPGRRRRRRRFGPVAGRFWGR